MHQYLFFIGNFPVRAYGLILALAFVIGLGITVYIMKAEGKKEYIEVLLDMAPLLLLCGVIGARIWHVFFFDWSYYSQHPGEIIAVWQGGLAIQGGVVGALLCGIIYLWRKKISFWDFADCVAPGLILGQGIGRDANLMNGDAFGGPSGGNFGILFPEGTLARQTYGDQPLWPAEVWEGQVDVLIFALLLILRIKKLPSGMYFLLYAFLYNLSRFFLEMLRGDSPRFLFHWTAAQWSSVVIMLISLVLMVWRFWRGKNGALPEQGTEEKPEN